jgi:ERCC4-type nuclease
MSVDAEVAGQIDADFQWTGNGPDGEVLVGIERKAVPDLLQSMRDRRLAGVQIGRMLQTYDICSLVVEGIWRRQRDTGLVEMPNGIGWHAARGRFHYREVCGFLASLHNLGAVHVWRTNDEEETCAWLASEYLWWQKPWTEHRSHMSVYAPPPERKSNGTRARMFRPETTLLERWLACLPHVDSRAIELAECFSSARDMADADVDRWMTVGHRIGKKTAQQIVEAIGGETGES